MAVFMLRKQRCVVGRETIQSAKSKLFTIWSSIGKVCQSLLERHLVAYIEPHQTSIMATLKKYNI